MGDLSENPLRKLIREMHRRGPIVLLAIAALPLPSTALSAQDLNIVLPVDSIEYLLAYAPLELPDALVGTRFEEDRTQRVDLAFQDGTTIFAKGVSAFAVHPYAATGQSERALEILRDMLGQRDYWGLADSHVWGTWGTADLLGDDPRYQALLEEAGITW